MREGRGGMGRNGEERGGKGRRREWVGGLVFLDVGK